MQQKPILVDHDLDAQTLEELATLRDARIGLAEKQLCDVDTTVSELINRRLIPDGDRRVYADLLRAELTQKIAFLKSIGDEVLSADDLAFYCDMLAE
jgi:hypothetical protein